MLATALFVSAGAMACVALKYDQVLIRRRLQHQVDDLRARIDAAELVAYKMWLRQDRIQSNVTERGWRDSHLLTKFDWRRPEDR